jgi:hypothetical protein
MPPGSPADRIVAVYVLATPPEMAAVSRALAGPWW